MVVLNLVNFSQPVHATLAWPITSLISHLFFIFPILNIQHFNILLPQVVNTSIFLSHLYAWHYFFLFMIVFKTTTMHWIKHPTIDRVHQSHTTQAVDINKNMTFYRVFITSFCHIMHVKECKIMYYHNHYAYQAYLVTKTTMNCGYFILDFGILKTQVAMSL